MLTLQNAPVGGSASQIAEQPVNNAMDQTELNFYQCIQN